MSPGQNCKHLGLAVLAILFAASFASAQVTNTVTCGEIGKLRVIDKPGNSYIWRIFTDKSLSKEVSNSEVEFLQGNSGPEVSVRWLKEGIYYFIVQSIGISGCTNQKVGKMEVFPPTFFADAGSDTIIGACQSISLDGSGSKGRIIKYEWSSLDPGGEISNTGNKSVLFSISSNFNGELPAKFRITLKVTDQSGNTDMDTIMIIIDIKPIARMVCSDLIDKNGYKIADGSTSTGTLISYNWKAGNGIINGDMKSPVVKVSVPGNYTLTVKDKYGCESTTTQKLTDFQHLIKANPDYGRCSWAEGLTIPVISNDYCQNGHLLPESVVITEKPLHGSVAVFPDGTVKYTPQLKISGRDQFRYKVFDNENLSDSAQVTIDVYDSPVLIPQGFSPNGDGLNDLLVFKGLENYPNSELIIFTKDGQTCFKSEDYQNDWNGKYFIHGLEQDFNVQQGVYYYSLKLGGTTRKIKGFVYIAY